jgi:hypothetical protein
MTFCLTAAVLPSSPCAAERVRLRGRTREFILHAFRKNADPAAGAPSSEAVSGVRRIPDESRIILLQ